MSVDTKNTYIRIYQLPINSEKIFRGSSTVDIDDYVCVWNDTLPGDFKGELTLEQLYTKFNLNCPYNFGGHSLSVSDIIEVFSTESNSYAHYYYCERAGWRDITEKIKK